MALPSGLNGTTIWLEWHRHLAWMTLPSGSYLGPIWPMSALLNPEILSGMNVNVWLPIACQTFVRSPVVWAKQRPFRFKAVLSHFKSPKNFTFYRLPPVIGMDCPRWHCRGRSCAGPKKMFDKFKSVGSLIGLVIVVYGIDGRLVFYAQQAGTYSLSHLPKGVYVVPATSLLVRRFPLLLLLAERRHWKWKRAYQAVHTQINWNGGSQPSRCESEYA